MNDKKTSKKLSIKKLKKKLDSLDLSYTLSDLGSSGSNPDDLSIQDEDVWEVIHSFYEQNSLIRHQIESYNDFIYEQIQKIIDQSKYIPIEENGKKYEIEFGQVILQGPKFTETDGSSHPLFPMECMYRNTNYLASSFIDVTITPPSGKPTHYDKIHIGDIPVMVRTDICNTFKIINDPIKLAQNNEDIQDKGGYFIVAPKSDSSGVAQRKVLITQERQAPNNIYIFENRNIKPKYKTYSEIRSISLSEHSTTSIIGYMDGEITCIIPWIELSTIPLGVLFKALGAKDANEISYYILGSKWREDKKALDLLSQTLEFSYECDSQEVAFFYIGKKGKKFVKNAAAKAIEIEKDDEVDSENEETEGKTEENEINKLRLDAISYAKHLLLNEFLPHLGQIPFEGLDTRSEKNIDNDIELNFRKKMIFVGYMVFQLVNVILGRKKIEDRDHYAKKRAQLAGSLLAQQYKGAFKKLTTDIIKNTKKALKDNNTVNILSWIKPSIITNALHSAISNNNWSIKSGNTKGISQILDQFNYAAFLANLRKCSIPMNAEGGKVIAPRDLHQSQAMIMCPAETPEGKKCLFNIEKISTPIGQVKIKDLKDGDIVYTVNPKNYKITKSKIFNYFQTKKKVFKLETQGGWSIRATKDHPFLTKNNKKSEWKELSDLKVGDKVYIINTIKPLQIQGEHKLIINDLSCLKEHLSFNVRKTYESSLEEIGLLPLYDDSPKLPILARICGFTFTDASLSINNGSPTWTGCFGTTKDCDEFNNDCEILGFDGKYKESTMTLKNGRKFKHSSYNIHQCAYFASLMIALGCKYGKKTKQKTIMPNWILNGSKLIQREFIAGLLGGDGGSVCFLKRKGKKNAYTFTFGDFSRHKHEPLNQPKDKLKNVDSLVKFMKQVQKILAKFKVLTFKPRVTKEEYEEETTPNDKEKHDSYNVLLPFSNSMDSIIAFAENVGYRYAFTKRQRTEKSFFYMKYKKDLWDERIALKKEIVERHDNGENYTNFRRKFENYTNFRRKFENYTNFRRKFEGRQIHSFLEQKEAETLAPRDILNPDDFLQENYYENGCFMEIKSITSQGVKDVADFTTESPNHSFIANNFVTHNCGLIKNLALSSYITIGSDPNPIKKMLKATNIIPFSEYAMCYFEDLKSKNSIGEKINYIDLVKILLNGDLIGVVKDPEFLTNELVKWKRTNRVYYDMSVAYNKVTREIRISTEAGRFARPLFIVEKGRLKISIKYIKRLHVGEINWTNLLSKGQVEIIDKEEEEHINIAGTPSELETKPLNERLKYTHCELHPSLMFGIGGSVIPFPDHNQCIHQNEPVLMYNGTSKKIKDVKIGDEVITFNPKTKHHSVTKVIDIHTGPTEKEMYKITTFSGRKITATFDHRFMTKFGWTRLENLKITNLEKTSDKALLAVSLEPTPVSYIINEDTIITEEMFRKIHSEYDIHPTILEKHIKDLKDNNFLPLKNTDDRLYILSRLFGFSLTDGSIFISNGVSRMSYDFEKKESAKLFLQDIIRLGVDKLEPRYYEKMFHGSLLKSWKVEYSGFLPSLLIALGYHPGKKTTQAYPEIPKWILNGSNLVKRDFLSTFQGGDGCRIRWNRQGFVIAETSKQVCEKYIKSLQVMMQQIVILLREFDVEVGDVKTQKYKKAEDRMTVSYKISNKKSNLIKYFDAIGYRYDIDKLVTSGINIEYIKYTEQIFIERKKLYDNNVKTIKNGPEGLPKGKEVISMERWREIVKSSSTTLFVPIKLITKVKNSMISDITTESENQSFISGDNICVHNSPRNCYQCIWAEEKILMADYTKKKMKNVKIGDMVISFNPQTFKLEKTRIINHFVKKTEKELFRIKTFSGRIIIATFDHKFMTDNGWLEVQEFKNDTCLLINLKGKVFFRYERIKSVDLVKNSLSISDITTESPNHTFITRAGFCVHNSSMGKQAIGLPFMNYRQMLSGPFHVMHYLQKPLALSKAASIIQYDIMPSGCNAMTAVMSRPFNEEDSIEANGSSFDRGFMNSTKFIAYYAEVREDKNEEFKVPNVNECQNFKCNTNHLFISKYSRLNEDDLIRKLKRKKIKALKTTSKEELVKLLEEKKYNSYSIEKLRKKLKQRGLNSNGDIPKLIQKLLQNDKCCVFKGQKVESGDVLIAKVIDSNPDNDIERKDKKYINMSIIFDHPWHGVVDAVKRGTTGDGYPYIRVVIAQFRVPIIGDKFCFTKDHEVQTTKGWIRIDKIKKEHKVASLKDDKLVYENPTEIMSFDAPEDMIELDTNQVACCVTPNHNMYVKTRHTDYKLREAKDLFNKEVHHKKDAEWDVKGLKEFILPEYEYVKTKNGNEDRSTFPEKKMPIDSWLILFGIWIAEGWANDESIIISVNKQRVLDSLKEHLPKLKIKYSINNKESKLYIRNDQLVNYFSPLSVYAINKSLPNWVWKLNKEQCQILLNAMICGPIYDTSSVKLKDDVMRLALHCGWAANAYIRSKKGTHKVRGRNLVTNAENHTNFRRKFENHTNFRRKFDAWRITIVKKQLSPAVNKHIKEQLYWVKISDKKVYCCTVPSGLLYVRRVWKDSKISQRPFWIGNSFRHGQKGVISMIYNQEDLPFTIDGINPDIIINSLAFPSRMTIAMLIEILTGLTVCLNSPLHNILVDYLNKNFNNENINSYKFRDSYISNFNEKGKTDIEINATPFREFDLSVIQTELKKLGLDGNGDTIMYDGITGLPLKAFVFFGPCYSQRLKHMVIDKVHARARGPKTTLSRQPREGRQNGGGLRYGVQERDCTLGQGASKTVRDRMMEQSDEYRTWICNICGLPAFVDKAGTLKECKVCGTNNVSKIKYPYGTKLVTQEYSSMNIIPRILTESFEGPLEEKK